MIKANIIQGGAEYADALIYKQPDESVLSYITNSMNNILQHTKNLSQQFVNSMTSIYDRFNSDISRQTSKMFLNRVGSSLDQMTLHYIRYEHLGLANLGMQPYILAQPELNNLFRKEMCYGYQDTYIPKQPNTYGEDLIEYKRVMDGVLQFEDNEEGLGFIKHYSQDDEKTHGKDLTTYDQFSIIDTWHNVSRMLANKLDPSDPLLGEL